MKRRALLIAVTAVPPPLAGVRRDVEGLAAWLRSGPGGAWRSTEIRVLVDPGRKALADDYKWLCGADYALLTFSGHGHHDGRTRESQLSFPRYVVPAESLVPRAEKAVAILDACREVVTLPLPRRFNPQVIAEDREHRDYRQEYEDLLDQATGTAVVYACAVGETAADSPVGGLFTSSLLIQGQEFSGSNPGGSRWLPMSAAFDDAATLTTQTRFLSDSGRAQTPEASYSCEEAQSLPFAV